jgi:hypothetical protein
MMEIRNGGKYDKLLVSSNTGDLSRTVGNLQMPTSYPLNGSERINHGK